MSSVTKISRTSAFFVALFMTLFLMILLHPVQGAIPVVLFSGGLTYFVTFLITKYIIKTNISSISNDDTTPPATTQDLSELERLKETAKFRKEFIGNVSHELKTPLFNIQGYLHTLIDGAMDDPKVNKEYLYKAAKSVDRLNAIVADLEDITMLEAGIQLNETKFDLRAVALEVAESMAMLADANDVSIEVEPGSPVEVLGDADKLRQVLDNLMDNAIKYGVDNGVVSVSFKTEADAVKTTIADNGIGISAEHISRIFERFYRVDKSRSREHGDTGLGLSIVKHIVEAHGQNISVESTPGEGTVFSFNLKRG